MPDSIHPRELAARYGARVTDLQSPVVIESDGQPVAVLISPVEYRRLCALASDAEQRQKVAWVELNTMLASIHSHSSPNSPQQIEAETTAASKEVKSRRARRRGD